MTVFIAGATGYMGSRLSARLIGRGHEVRALTRASSAGRLPSGCHPVVGDALHAGSFASAVSGSDVFIHLVGTAHPAPWKGAQFRAVDRPSLLASVEAAILAGVGQFVYVSVAHPAPIMRAYIEVRRECEESIRNSGLSATILRPWYVVGPGHWWPILLAPVYRAMERSPARRDLALRIGLLRLGEMLDALVWAAENPASGIRILEVPAIRSLRLPGSSEPVC